MPVRGQDQLRARLARMGAPAKAEIRRTLGVEAARLVQLQKALAPVDDGNLRDSITWRYGDEDRIAHSQGIGGGHELSVRITAGNDQVRYAHLVEGGAAPHEAGGMFEGAQHPGAQAQPFFFASYRLLKRSIGRKLSASYRRAAKLSGGGS